jgi:hypothetical protein
MNTTKMIGTGMIHGRALSYHQRMRNLWGSSIVARFKITDGSGLVMVDDVNGRNGGYNGPSLAAIASPIAGELAPTFDGVNDDIDIYAACSAMNFATEGALVGWSLIPPEVWTDGSARDILSLYALTGDNFILKKAAPNKQLWAVSRYGGVDLVMQMYFSSPSWFTWGFTWHKGQDLLRFLLNGVIPFPDQHGLGAWSGELYPDYTRLGGFGGGVEPFKGSTSNVYLLNRMITEDEHRQFTEEANHLPVLSVIGDSISTGWSSWPYRVAGELGYILKDHAALGLDIEHWMASQAAATAGDHANLCIMALGTNDDNGGDMSALQAKVRNGIDTVRANNPGVVIKYMNALPRWTDVGGGTPVDKSNIRAAILAACTAKGVACWDMFTDPVLTAADTEDGIHPSYPVGSGKVAAKAVTLLS